MKEIYFVSDIETNGPIPGDFSMLSLASVVVVPGDAPQPPHATGESWYGRFYPLGAAREDTDTMKWWSKQHPDARHEAFNAEPRLPAELQIQRYDMWVETVAAVYGGAAPIFVAKPTGFDFTFVMWYLHHFIKNSIFNHRALDIRSFAMGMGRGAFKDCETSTMMARFSTATTAQPHHALHDAQELADLFRNLLLHQTTPRGEK